MALLELKRGGFCLTQKESDQARDYAKEIRKGGKLLPSTEIVVYVLGASLEAGLERAEYGSQIT